MDLFHKIMALVDKNSDKIPEGDYLELCDTIHELRRHLTLILLPNEHGNNFINVGENAMKMKMMAIHLLMQTI